MDVPQGRWFSRIPFLWPVNAPDTFLLNIAKFTTHLMGLSLGAKNLQGANAIPYVRHCAAYNSDLGISPDHVQPGAKERIFADDNRHLNPHDISLYEWKADGTAVRAILDSFPRFNLRTPYLRKDYGGQQQAEWHLVNESYDYTRKVARTVNVHGGWNLVSIPMAVLNSRVIEGPAVPTSRT